MGLRISGCAWWTPRGGSIKSSTPCSVPGLARWGRSRAGRAKGWRGFWSRGGEKVAMAGPAGSAGGPEIRPQEAEVVFGRINSKSRRARTDGLLAASRISPDAVRRFREKGPVARCQGDSRLFLIYVRAHRPDWLS